MADKVPVWEKANLTNEDNCPFVLWNGSKRMIKRKAFKEYLESAYSI